MTLDVHPSPLPVRDPASRRAALVAVLGLALALRVWGLEQNGWGADYYSAAVRSMARSAHNFFFAAFDPFGFISVDKPPVALWIQVASVKLLGWQPMALLLPQAVMGTASVGLLYAIVRRAWDGRAALTAALMLALMPVLVAVNRSNNMDSTLLFMLLLAAWPLLVAAQTGRRSMLLLAMALLGVAFNVKMLAAFITLPAMLLSYGLAAPLPMRRRLADLLMAGLVLVLSAFSWALAVESVPPDARPFVGSSKTNSVFELMVGHNGLGRFVALLRPVERSAAGATAARGLRPESSESAGPAASANDAGANRSARSPVSRLFVRSPAGPMRLFEGQLAAQVMWWLPLAASAAFAWIAVPALRVRRERWAGGLLLMVWLLSAWTVFSATGGIMHFYYLAVLAPPLAALAGIGASLCLQGTPLRVLAVRRGLLLLLLVSLLWQWHVHASAQDESLLSAVNARSGWQGWLVGLQTLLAGLAALGWLLSGRTSPTGRLRGTSLGLAGLSLLILPAAWALSSVLLPGHNLLPSADLRRFELSPTVLSQLRFGQLIDTRRLVSYLQDHWDGERYLVATSGAYLAAPIIVQWGEPVMARGGFHGVDPAIELPRFIELVRTRQLRFAMLGDLSLVSRRLARNVAGNPVNDWIRANGRPIDPALWRDSRLPAASELYDLQEAMTTAVPAVR